VAVLGLIAVTAVAFSRERPTADTISDAQRTSLEERAGRMAVFANGDVPSTAEVVLTTRQTSQDLVAGGDVVLSDQPVYLVQMEGEFTAPRHPQGVDAPTGTTLWFVVDVATGEQLDMGVGPQSQDLSTLGGVSTITPIPPSGT
jgi:hypothetical protein